MQKDNNMSNTGSSTSSFVSGLGRPDPGTPPTDYRAFLESKTHYAGKDGFKPNFVPDYLFGFQKDLLTWAVEKGRAAIFADCGLGKTPLQLVWAENVVRGTNGRVLVLTPLAVSQQTISEGEKFGIEVKRSRDGRSEGYITVTNYEQLEKFNPSDFVGVVCDECFPPDTPIDVFNIDMVLESRYIKDVHENDLIYNAGGKDHVEKIYKRRINRAVQICIDGRKITSSENHPFFTLYGWRSAQDLQPGDYLMATRTAMRLVRHDIQPQFCSIEDAEILRQILLSEMEDEHRGAQAEGTHEGNPCADRIKKECLVRERNPCCQKRTGSDQESESDVKPGNESEGVCYIAEDEAQTFRAWGEWDWFDGPATDFIGCSWKRLDSGIYFVTGPTSSGLSDRLQTRLGESRKKNQHRSGRTVTLQSEGSGREAGCYGGFSRVDSVEILEQGHPELEKYRDAEGHIYFYDIKAERHPSFSVDGLLVHNSSILKNFSGAYRKQITQFMRKMRYRLLCTATAAPNDYTELGTSSEALGVMGYMDMLNYFFKNDNNTSDTKRSSHHGGNTAKWRFKKHAQEPFWKWVCSWARAVRRPSDLGHNNDGFVLPPLYETETVIGCSRPLEGKLFVEPAIGLYEQRQERRATIQERCEAAAEKVSHDKIAVVWCHLNEEGDLLERMIPDAQQVKGSMPDEKKEEILMAFSRGEVRALVIKPKIGCFGLNWQNCNHMTFFPSHSYEQYYQAVRRCWRFGQTKPVTVDIITTEGEIGVLKNLQRKAEAADRMFDSLVGHMNNAIKIDRSKLHGKVEVPTWLQSRK